MNNLDKLIIVTLAISMVIGIVFLFRGASEGNIDFMFAGTSIVSLSGTFFNLYSTKILCRKQRYFER